jgi:hypothetical protein
VNRTLRNCWTIHSTAFVLEGKKKGGKAPVYLLLLLHTKKKYKTNKKQEQKQKQKKILKNPKIITERFEWISS